MASASDVTDEIFQMVRWMKNRIKLSDFQNSHWNDEHTCAAQTYIKSQSTKTLFVYVDLKYDKLFLRSVHPKSSRHITEVAYFIKPVGTKLALENISSVIQYGKLLTKQTASNILQLMEKVIYPHIMTFSDLPHSTEKEITGYYHRFMASLTVDANKAEGKTVLYLPPKSDCMMKVEDAVQDRFFIQQLESIVIQWSKQIKTVLNNHEALCGNTEILGPLEEIRFWRLRDIDLSSISSQLNSPEVKNIRSILAAVKSVYLASIGTLSTRILEVSNEAKNNIKFLEIMSEVCEKLSVSKPSGINPLLPDLLNRFRIVCSHSQYYNTNELISGFIRKISNEIVRRCYSEISLYDIFEGNIYNATIFLEDSIKCCESWKKIYKRTESAVNSTPGKKWKFDDATMFALVDAFTQRCRDLLQICDGQKQFLRKNSSTNKGESGHIPKFCGSKETEAVKMLLEIETLFKSHVKKLQNVSYDILDVKSSNWHDDFNEYKSLVKDLDVMYTNIIHTVFAPVNKIEDAVYLLELFSSMIYRNVIQQCIEKKKYDVRNLFIRYCHKIREEFEHYRQKPLLRDNEPQYSGSVLWAQSLLDKIECAWISVTTTSSCNIIVSTDNEALNAYNSLMSSIKGFQANRYKDWVESLSSLDSESIQRYLEIPVVKKIASMSEEKHRMNRAGNLMCNFEPFLLSLFAEFQYWEKVHDERFEIPHFILRICQQRSALKVSRELIMKVVRGYNSLLSDLTVEEHRLFTDHLRQLDKVIHYGLTKLLWASRSVVIEKYVQTSTSVIREIHQIIKSFHEKYDIVYSSCDMISSLALVKIDQSTNYNQGSFESHQADHRQASRKIITESHHIILKLVSEISTIFKSGSNEVQQEWRRLVESVDQRIEEAVKKSILYSLKILSSAINGESNDDAQTLFHVKVLLDYNIEFRPTMIDLTHIVNTITKEVISIVSLPLIKDSLLSIEHSKDDKRPKCSSSQEALHIKLASDEDVLNLLNLIMNGMTNTASNAHTLLTVWEKYEALWEMDKESFLRRYSKSDRSLATFEKDILRYIKQQRSIETEESHYFLNFMRLDFLSLKSSLISHSIEWQEKLTSLLHRNANQKLCKMMSFIDSVTHKLTRPPSDLNTLKEVLNTLKEVKSDMSALKCDYTMLEATYRSLSTFDVEINNKEVEMLESLRPKWNTFNEVIGEAEINVEDSKTSMKAHVINALSDFSKDVQVVREDFISELSKIVGDTNLSVEHALNRISSLRQFIDAARKREETFLPGLSVFAIEPKDYKELKECEYDLNFLDQIWTLSAKWEKNSKQWNEILLKEINIESLESTVMVFSKDVSKLRKDISSWNIWQNLKDRIESFKLTLPTLLDLKSKALREHHWQSLKKELGKDFDSSSQKFKLGDVWSLNLMQFSASIREMEEDANKELVMEQTLKDVESRWIFMNIDISEYKNTYKVRSTEELFTTLEDDTLSLSSMKSSKYYTVFKQSIDHWEQQLSLISEVVEMILAIQRKWMYIESIFFSSGDISKQLPEEYNVFVQVNEKFQSMMTAANSDPRINRICCHDAEKLTDLREMNRSLEKIQKSLDQYLEMKRMTFPRFYFVSDDDLLEILGKSKEPLEVQKHVKKCFEGIQSMILIPPTESAANNKHYLVSGCKSPDGEALPFVHEIALDGPVELWFTKLLTEMRIGVQKALLGCLNALKVKKKEEWVLECQGQLLISVGAIHWTGQTNKALGIIHKGIDKNAMRSLKKKQVLFLRRLTKFVRNPSLGKVDRSKTVALITMEIHNRDVIEKLIKNGCSDTQDFVWQSQLRFFFNKDDGPYGKCSIRQTNSELPYLYEYQGNNGRLVVTPLTDRCILTLVTALQLHRGGSPLGPAGTGKTETVKDLAKNIGQYCVVSNCSDGMDFKSIGRIFSGLCQSGSWGCFDEFNRIKIEVISVVAMQVLSILNAQKSQQSHFLFMGNMISCSRYTGIFITMNPGYAGRTELPDNLKAIMRPVAMMTPDLFRIAEVMLASEGFVDARILAKKIITLYNLMQLQLSKQDHYDYGLRNLKAVLCMAGSLKRTDPSLNEELVIMRALSDMNLPKFVEDDIPLFEHLISDLFPGIDLPVNNSGRLKDFIEMEFKRNGHQIHPPLIETIFQLYNSQQTRHSNMLVGGTLRGKTTSWKTLAAAKTALAKETNDGKNSVVTHIINPKSVTLSELYGQYDLQTFEWSDGILSSIFKRCAESEKEEEKWMVFDGPVDAMWVESMNSVMDDSKLLTLINGDRIPLNSSMTLLFEVENLAVASPATVSRAGMIYYDASDLGWGPFVASWILKRSRGITEITAFYHGLFDKYVKKVLAFKEENCKEPVALNDFSAIKSLVALYDIFSTDETPEVKDAVEIQRFCRCEEKRFVFCVVWTVMAAVDQKGREQLDYYLRDIEGVFPPLQTVYDYFFDTKRNEFELWETKLGGVFKHDSSIPVQEIFVPTVDSIRNSNILSSYAQSRYHVLICGDVGNGKTVLVNSSLAKFPDSYSVLRLSFSSSTTSSTTQELIESSMEKRSRDKLGPNGGKQLIVFIDDFNMPKKTSLESPFQPPLELVRLWIDYGGWYDRKKCSWNYIVDSQIVAAMAPPIGGREEISKRTQSRFCLLNCTSPDDSQVIRIFQNILAPVFNTSDSEISSTMKSVTRATVMVYKAALKQFPPTPTKSHYLFDLRDISKVIQGLVRARNTPFDSKESVLKLWVHECMRSFSDRFPRDSNNDELRFVQIVSQILKESFGTDLKSLVENTTDTEWGPIFTSIGNLKHNESYYMEVKSTKQLQKVLVEKLEEYNSELKNVPMNLVLFYDAIKHICRIHRVLEQYRGNMMLVGYGGSGRQSLARLASYIAEVDVFTIKITKKYGSFEFREDLKNLFLRCGVENKATVLLLYETQITNDAILEDVNSILCLGEVPNMFENDEMSSIFESIRKVVCQAGLPDTSSSIWNFFLKRVKSNLHVILTVSPVGDTFRRRCTMFPALINCSYVDWFNVWPVEALTEVSNKFLTIRLSDEGVRDRVAKVTANLHTIAIDMSNKMSRNLKRFNYVTPTHYLELVKAYLEIFGAKETHFETQRTKLSNGLSKLEESREQVETMAVELEKKKETVAQSQQECEEMLKIIVLERRDAEKQKKQVEEDSERIRKEEQECQAIALDAEKDLAIAMPALEKAMQEVKKLNKASITEIKAYSKPPAAVEKVLSCVMIFFGRPTDWSSAKKTLGEATFLTNIKSYDKDNVRESIINKVKKYISNPSFAAEEVIKVSVAAGALCFWCHAIYVYAGVSKQVEPKRAILRAAQEKLEVKQRCLAEAKKSLELVISKVNSLKKKYEVSVSEKNKLKLEAENLEDKLCRAEKLINGLGGEYTRWQSSVKAYGISITSLIGDALIASAFLSYAGPFDTLYRDELVSSWIAAVEETDLPLSKGFNFSSFFSDPVSVRDWNLQGLPKDNFSTENGVIVTRCSRWPLMIDPQGQAKRWINAMEGNRLKVVDLQGNDYLRDLEFAISYGLPVLLKDVEETIDPSIDTVVSKSIIRIGNRNVINLADKDIEYNNSFRLYITTKLSNPHYSPEICTKTTIVNFSVKKNGLEDQLLGIVVNLEEPKLESKKNDLKIQVLTGEKKLLMLEDEILRLLAESKGSLLDDIDLINTLQDSKVVSEEVTIQLKTAEETVKKIDILRESYRPAATRSSVLFFVLNGLSKVDAMYQFSLDSYIELFSTSIMHSKSNVANVNDRVEAINQYHTLSVYNSTCIGLFEKHKFLFSMHLSCSILTEEKKLPKDELNFFSYGCVNVGKNKQKNNPFDAWLTETMWVNLEYLDSSISSFNGIIACLQDNTNDWKNWVSDNKPEECVLPGCWDDKLTLFQRLCIVRALRSDRVFYAATKFINGSLGKSFTSPPQFKLNEIFNLSNSTIPLIFLLSPGVDPTEQVQQLAKSHKTNLIQIALGQGQAPIALQAIAESLQSGSWVFLSNCHLMLSWIPELEKIVEKYCQTEINDKYRLWLSCCPTPNFSITLLQRGIKITTEPPRGLRSNLMKIYSNMTNEKFCECSHSQKHNKLLFALSWFHSIMIERRKFKSLGFNVPYDFNDSDFSICHDLVIILLNEYPDPTPFEALRYLIGEVNYGGRVTDIWDQRLVNVYLDNFFSEQAIDQDNFQLSDLSDYYIPSKHDDLDSFLNYIKKLPSVDHPAAFGQHSNAEISCQIEDTNDLLQSIISLQPDLIVTDNESTENMVDRQLVILIEQVPEPFNLKAVKSIIRAKSDPDALKTVLIQEIVRYNSLLLDINSDLTELGKAIKGITMMTPYLEKVLASINGFKVPDLWSSLYPSLKPLGSWMRDLNLRIKQLRSWVNGSIPSVFWLSAFTFPTGFLTAVLQCTARKNGIAIDTLSWEFSVVSKSVDDITKGPDEGVYIKGIFIEGARWDNVTESLAEPLPMELISTMPIIHFKPIEGKKKTSKNMYVCPLYMYPIRSTSFVQAIELKCGDVPSQHWVKRGTALLLSTYE